MGPESNAGSVDVTVWVAPDSLTNWIDCPTASVTCGGAYPPGVMTTCTGSGIGRGSAAAIDAGLVKEGPANASAAASSPRAPTRIPAIVIIVLRGRPVRRVL